LLPVDRLINRTLQEKVSEAAHLRLGLLQTKLQRLELSSALVARLLSAPLDPLPCELKLLGGQFHFFERRENGLLQPLFADIRCGADGRILEEPIMAAVIDMPFFSLG